MRRTINVLWLDDIVSEGGSEVSYLENAFQEALKKQGYRGTFVTVSSIDEAMNKISDNSNRIDFFVSDYNLDGKQSGISFLNTIRKEKRLKEHFVLYSNNDESRIRTEIIKELNDENELLDNLTNYSFFSTASNSSKSSLIKKFGESIALALSRWEELSALRGEYASLNTLAEWIARRIMFSVTSDNTYVSVDNSPLYSYSKVIKDLKTKVVSGNLPCGLSDTTINNIFNNWDKCRESRNTLEHNTEKWDFNSRGYYISKPDGSDLIFEKDMASKRTELINQMSSINDLFTDLASSNDILGYLENDPDYISFKDSF